MMTLEILSNKTRSINDKSIGCFGQPPPDCLWDRLDNGHWSNRCPNTNTEKQIQIQIGWVGPPPDHSWERQITGTTKRCPTQTTLGDNVTHTPSLLDLTRKWWDVHPERLQLSGIHHERSSQCGDQVTLTGTAWPNVPHAPLISPRLLLQIHSRLQCFVQIQSLFVVVQIQSNFWFRSSSNPSTAKLVWFKPSEPISNTPSLSNVSFLCF